MQANSKTIVLISCASMKHKSRMKAKNIYRSSLFKKSLEYANGIKHDYIYILSAKHHLLELDSEIDPYDVTLSYISPNKRKPGLTVLNDIEKSNWGNKVIQELESVADLKNDLFIVLAGSEYITPIENKINNLDDRLKGLKYGQRLKWLTNNTN